VEDRPTRVPAARNGWLKPITQAILERRATVAFTDDAVPDDVLGAILQLGLQAPSGYNLQPWRFIVVRDPANRARLQSVANDQAKVSQAPIVVIAVGLREAWRAEMDEVFLEGLKRGLVKRPADVTRGQEAATRFLDGMSRDVWVNRHTMIAVTYMMLVAEAYGYDTAPMEGFDAEGVKREFGIPDDAEVVALLGIGRARPPDKPYPGRFPVDRMVYAESFGTPWSERSRA
jgi:nitroreductase